MMPDREKVIDRIHNAIDVGVCVDLFMDILELLKEQDAENSKIANAYLKLVGKASKQPQIVRCKDCIYGTHEKDDISGMTKIFCQHHWESRPEEWFCASGTHI